ncbi:MAG TPA: TIGR03086 family protein, partial [Vicinamibacteria bacterium]
PADEYTWQMVAEHLLHGWDLAAATGADRRLDAVVVSACAGWFLDRERLFRDAGAIGPRVAVPSGADEQDKLLAAYGRDPDWSR